MLNMVITKHNIASVLIQPFNPQFSSTAQSSSQQTATTGTGSAWNDISWYAHLGTLSREEGSNSRNDPGVQLVYSESTRRRANAHIGETSQPVANSGMRAL